MNPKFFATFLIVSAFTAACADTTSAQGNSFKGQGFNGFQGRGSGFYGRGHRRSGVGVWGLVDNYGYDSESGPDWYGISSGYDPCPLFRQRVKTPNGWRVAMVPVC